MNALRSRHTPSSRPLAATNASNTIKYSRLHTCTPFRMAVESARSTSVQASSKTEQLSSEQWSQYHQRWFDIWQAERSGKIPAFDKGSCSPQLLQLLQEGDLDVRGKRVIVPGCGRGYDVMAFAAAGAALSVGLDICPTAIAAAAAERDKELSKSAAATAAATELLVGDFFSYVHSDGAKFDTGYDYTFLCALHPGMRQAWAEGWARLLVQGAELLTMIYPVDSSMDQNSGPPWPVTPELYKQLLPPAGFELISLSQIPNELSHPSRAGREWLGRWKLTGH